MQTIKTVVVVGANGTMGSLIGGIFASFGNAKVYMVSRDVEKSQNAIAKSAKSVRAQAIVKNMIPVDYSSLDTCVPEADLVFESVREEFSVKFEITERIGQCASKDAIVCSGTSGLSLAALSEALPPDMRPRYLGVHMFNPPYSLTFCELVPTQVTSRELVRQIKDYLTSVLFRTVVQVKDSPAFLGNRVGFQFINEALQFAERFADKGGVDYIDSILGPFTGRGMAPLVTCDYVGLDVHAAIVNNVYANTTDYAHETFALPAFVSDLILRGMLGVKTGQGLYKTIRYENGAKEYFVYDIATGKFRQKKRYAFPFATDMIQAIHVGDYMKAFRSLTASQTEEAQLCIRFLAQYIIYSLVSAEEVAGDFHAADHAFATGFNWCPPLALLGVISSVCDFKSLAKELFGPALDAVDLDKMLAKAEPSAYNYRPFFRAK